MKKWTALSVRRSVGYLTAECLGSELWEKTQQDLAVPKARRYPGICLNVLSRNKNFRTLKQKKQACFSHVSPYTARHSTRKHPKCNSEALQAEPTCVLGTRGQRIIPRV